MGDALIMAYRALYERGLSRGLFGISRWIPRGYPQGYTRGLFGISRGYPQGYTRGGLLPSGLPYITGASRDYPVYLGITLTGISLQGFARGLSWGWYTGGGLTGYETRKIFGGDMGVTRISILK